MASGTPSCTSQGCGTENSDKQKNKIHKTIRATLFFDGTLNNMTNTKKGMDGEVKIDVNEESSYANYYSNVALLKMFVDADDKNGYDIYVPPIYTEGIGSINGEEDSQSGYAFGSGGTGVRSKVDKGLKYLLNEIKSGVSDFPKSELIIDEIRLDVFGFSRGAAAARHFVNKALNQTFIMAGDHLIVCDPIKVSLEKEKYSVSKVKVYFVGLFDTVSSVGLSGTAGEMSNVAELGLDAISAADFVYHLASADEHRENFALTNIKSAGSGKEVFLPGVHSDIGGSYNDYAIERFEIYNTNVPYITEGKYKSIESELGDIISEGWFKKTDLYHKDAWRKLSQEERIKEAVNGHGQVFVERSGDTKIPERPGLRNLYSRIPLHFMKKKASENKVAFLETINSDEKTHIVPGKVPKVITDAYNMLIKYADTSNSINSWKICSPLLYDLRMNYFHFSANYKVAAKILHPYAPRYKGGVRTRKIHDG